MSLMRRFLVLALLIATMFGMQWLKGGLGQGSLAITFAAIGFVVLAAYAMAELASAVGLPRVTGYIVAGLGLGPSAAAMMGLSPPILTEAAVGDMKVFNGLALALIALEAGLELNLEALRRFKRTLSSIILFKMPLSWLMVGGGFVALALTVMPVPGVTEFGHILAIGLVVGALSVGTSPAVSIAVISESGIKGKVADLVLGFAVFKDVVMVIMIAVAIAVGTILITDGAAFDAGPFLKLLKKVFFSAVFGGVIGGLLVAWMRWVRWEIILILLVVAYGVNSFSAYLHDVHSTFQFKPLLLFITAGFVVGNFSRYGHALHKPLGLLALPVFVIFFTTAGAGLNLEATIAMLPLACSLFAIRALMMYLSARWGGKLAGETTAFSNNLWLGFISQAGVALVLLKVAQDGLPALAAELELVAFPLITLNLLIGPILLRVALKRGQGIDVAPPPGDSDADAGPTAATPWSGFDDGPIEPALADVLGETTAALDALGQDLRTRLLAGWREAGQQRLDATAEGDRFKPAELKPAAAFLRGRARKLRDSIAQLPVAVKAGLPDGDLTAEHGALHLPTTLFRLRRSLGKTSRRVDTRALVRTRVEGRVLPMLAEVLDRIGGIEAARIDLQDRQQRQARGAARNPEAERRELETLLDTAQADLERHIETTLESTIQDVAYHLHYAETPRIDSKAIQFPSVSRQSQEQLKRLERDGVAWDDALAAVMARAELRHQLLLVEQDMDSVCENAIDAWSEGQRDILLSLVTSVRDAVVDACAALGVPEPAEGEASRSGEELAAALTSSAGTTLEDVYAQIARLDEVLNQGALPRIADFRLSSESQGPLVKLEQLVTERIPEVDEKTAIAPTGLDMSAVEGPETVTREVMPVSAIVDKYLVGELAWSLAETRAEDEEIVARLEQRVGEMAGSLTVGLKGALEEMKERGLDHSDHTRAGVAFARESMARARRIADTLYQSLSEEFETVPKAIRASSEDAFVRIYQRLLGEPDASPKPQQLRRERLRRVAETVVSKSKNAVRKVKEVTKTVRQRITGSDMAERARLRSGSEHADPSRMARDVFAREPSKDQVERMPYVLARLFSPSRLDTHHLLTGVDEQVNALAAAYERFERGIPTAVVVQGDAGSGKTSMARVTLRNLVGRRLEDVVLEADHRSEAALCEALGIHGSAFAARSFTSLQQALLKEGGTILLDGLEQVFVRNQETLQLVRRLLSLIMATRQRVFWVVSIDEPTMRLLEPLCDFSAYFTDHVELPPFDAEQLGTLIESRCRLAGFDIEWPTVASRDRNLLLRLARRRQTVQEQRTRFLRTLAKTSGGNARDALTQFMNAIVEVESEAIRLGPITVAPLSWFDQLGRDAHRLLALHVLCGPLSFAECQSSLLWAPPRLEAAKARLLGAGLLVRERSGTERLKLRSHVWRVVTDALIARGELLGPTKGGS